MLAPRLVLNLFVEDGKFIKAHSAHQNLTCLQVGKSQCVWWGSQFWESIG